MSATIQLEGVGKRYRLGEHHGSGTDLRDRLSGLGSRLRRREPRAIHEIWSLRDVSFEVEEGQALGVIGANGAGKSTLLKIITGVTTPTVGISRTRGRIGSLLEVGTGFHPELTGIENAFLNGAILGMTRKEVTRQLDSIIEFAGLQEFMDTPVKRYSSGMYLRLGFAVAAHLTAEILLIDEVLAVGDSEFQQRCLGKMGEIERSGRTVVFVSHNLEAVAELCAKSVWLQHGRVMGVGPTRAIVSEYLGSIESAKAAGEFEVDSAAAVQIQSVALLDAEGRPVERVMMSDPVTFVMDIVVNRPVRDLDAAFRVVTGAGKTLMLEAFQETLGESIVGTGRVRLKCELPAMLPPGVYSFDAILGDDHAVLDERFRAARLVIDGNDEGGQGRAVRLRLPWTLEQR